MWLHLKQIVAVSRSYSRVLTMAGVIITAAVSMFPFVMPSSTHPEQSLLMWDANIKSINIKLNVLTWH